MNPSGLCLSVCLENLILCKVQAEKESEREIRIQGSPPAALYQMVTCTHLPPALCWTLSQQLLSSLDKPEKISSESTSILFRNVIIKLVSSMFLLCTDRHTPLLLCVANSTKMSLMVGRKKCTKLHR